MNLSRKVSAFLATLGMIFAGLVAGFFNPASAESTTITSFTNNSTITVEAASDVDISGRTLKAIPLGYYTSAVTKSDSTDTLDNVTVGKVDDTRDTAIRDALVKAELVTKTGTDPNFTYAAAQGACTIALDTSNYAGWVAACLHDSTASPWAGKLRNFVTALDTALGDSASYPALTEVANGKNKKQVTGLRPGLYVILDRTANTDRSTRAIPMVVGTDVVYKSSTYNKLGTQDLGKVEYKLPGAPDFDKNILEDKNATATPTNYSDDTATKRNEVSIGDTVTFELKVTVPLTAGYESYWLELTDTLSEGLTFGEIKSVTSDTTPEPTTLTKDTDYRVIGTGTNGVVEANQDGTTSFRVLFGPKQNTTAVGGFDSNILQDGMETKFATGRILKVVYTAKLNAKAVVEDAGNPNEVRLVYFNNPDDTTKKTTTPPKETRTYTGQFTICKTDTGNNPLQGAEFELYNGDNTDAGNKLGFLGEAGNYKLPTGAANEGTPATTLSTDDSGCIKFEGLKSGDYTLKETKAPANFSSIFMPTVTFTLTVTEPTAPATTPAYSSIVEKGNRDSNNLVSLGTEKTITGAANAEAIKVHDSAIVHNVRNIGELPKTGAAWLAIFAGGTVLFAAMGAALMFMGRRRTNS